MRATSTEALTLPSSLMPVMNPHNPFRKSCPRLCGIQESWAWRSYGVFPAPSDSLRISPLTWMTWTCHWFTVSSPMLIGPTLFFPVTFKLSYRTHFLPWNPHTTAWLAHPSNEKIHRIQVRKKCCDLLKLPGHFQANTLPWALLLIKENTFRLLPHLEKLGNQHRLVKDFNANCIIFTVINFGMVCICFWY